MSRLKLFMDALHILVVYGGVAGVTGVVCHTAQTHYGWGPTWLPYVAGTVAAILVLLAVTMSAGESIIREDEEHHG